MSALAITRHTQNAIGVRDCGLHRQRLHGSDFVREAPYPEVRVLGPAPIRGMQVLHPRSIGFDRRYGSKDQRALRKASAAWQRTLLDSRVMLDAHEAIQEHRSLRDKRPSRP